jgi:hypothetical protein
VHLPHSGFFLLTRLPEPLELLPICFTVLTGRFFLFCLYESIVDSCSPVTQAQAERFSGSYSPRGRTNRGPSRPGFADAGERCLGG